MRYLILSCIFWAASIQILYAQKRALSQEDYKSWRTIREVSISTNGRWITYKYNHLYDRSDSLPDLYLYDTRKKTTIGWKDVSNWFFFNQGDWARVIQKKVDSTGMEVDSTFFIRLADRKKIYWNETAFPNVDNTSWIVYTKSVSDVGGTGNSLYLWNIETDKRIEIPNVGMYTLFNHRKSIIYESKEATRTALIVQELGQKPRKIFECPARCFGGFYFDETRGEGTFIVASDTGVDVRSRNLLYAFRLSPFSCEKIVDLNDVQDLPAGVKIARKAYPLINDGRDIMLELEPLDFRPAPPMPKLDLGFELELWTWNEATSRGRQRMKRGGFNLMDYPRYVYHVDTKTHTLLPTKGMENLVFPQASTYDYIFAYTTEPYLTEFDWRHDLNADYYLISLRTGETRKVLENTRFAPNWSPNGKYAVWYNEAEKGWFQINLSDGTLTNISSSIPYPVFDELHDMPKAPDPYGLAGWLNNGESVVLYDRYDMWVVSLTGTHETYSLTKEYGRKHEVQLRLTDNGSPQGGFLSGFNERTKATALYFLEKNGTVTCRIDGDYTFHLNGISSDGKVCVWTKSRFDVFGDLWWSDAHFTKTYRVTDANPQQRDFYWGSARLIRWNTFAGKENEGILFLPEDYDASRDYPMIVTFYERHTDGLFSYRIPEFSSSVIDVPTYVSNGYVVFMPDIHYKVGNPAESCYDAVISGTQELIKQGIADKEHIGLIGHSWGGYEVAYLVTKTDMFRCASPGAAVVDLISSYTALRGGGRPRLYVYEDAQGRLGKTLWEDQEMYIRNSPIFEADKIRTPLLIFHCDGDNAVPFAQGLDLFLSMRRLNRPAWLLNYRGEGHALGGEAAMIDWGIRMRQFFDFYLKGKPMPRWMKEGISVDEQGYDLKYDYIQ